MNSKGPFDSNPALLGEIFFFRKTVLTIETAIKKWVISHVQKKNFVKFSRFFLDFKIWKWVSEFRSSWRHMTSYPDILPIIRKLRVRATAECKNGALPVIKKSLPVCLKFDKNVGKRPQRRGICDVIMTSYSDILHTNQKLRFRTIALIAN